MPAPVWRGLLSGAHPAVAAPIYRDYQKLDIPLVSVEKVRKYSVFYGTRDHGIYERLDLPFLNIEIFHVKRDFVR